MWSSLKEYHRPATMDEVFRLLGRQSPRTVPLAGGTWLVARRDPTIEAVVDLSHLRLNFAETTSNQLHLGAVTTLQSLVDNPMIDGLVGDLLSKATRQSGSITVRNVATIGGSLIVAGSTNELALVLLVLDTQVIVRSPTWQSIPLGDFLAQRKQLQAGGIITEIVVPLPPENVTGALSSVSHTPRSRPIVNAAALVSRDGNTCHWTRLAVGGIGPHPRRLKTIEQTLLGVTPDEGLTKQLAKEISAAISTETNGATKYMIEMTGLVAVRALHQAWEQVGRK